MDSDSGVDSAALEESEGRAMNEITCIGGQRRIAARQIDAAVRALKAEFITQVHRLHHRFQLMKAVGALAENVQQQIDFTRRWLAQRHDIKNAPTPKRCWRIRNLFNSVVENAKAAALNHRRYIAAAEAERSIG